MFRWETLQKVLPRLHAFLPRHFNPARAFPPLHAYFEVTYRCNLRCDMCHFLEIIEDTEKHRKFDEELSTAALKSVIARLPRFTIITFTGGEAFMKRDFMEILRFAAAGHKVHIITNGTGLNPQMADQLMETRTTSLWRRGLFFVGVSLQGSRETHDAVTAVPGAYDKTFAGLERLIARRGRHRYPKVHLTCVIRRNNVHDLVTLYDEANRMKVDICNFVLDNPAEFPHWRGFDQEHRLDVSPPPVETIEPGLLRDALDGLVRKSRNRPCRPRFSPNGITPEEIVRYYSNRGSFKDYRCGAAWSKVGVSAYGDVFSCPHARMGNVEDNGGLPWNTPCYREFRQRLKREKIFPGCLGCCQSEYTGG